MPFNRAKRDVRMFGTFILMGMMIYTQFVPVRAADPVTPATAETQTYVSEAKGSIDYTQKGSVVIHKYDLTAMTKDGIDFASKTSNGSVVDTSGWEKYTIQGVVFSYLRVADIAQYSNGQEVQMVYGFTDTNLLAILGLNKDNAFDSSKVDSREEGTRYYFSSDQITKAMKTMITNDNTAAKGALEDYLIANGTAMAETDENGVSSISSQDLGLYLFAETAVPEEVDSTVDPFMVSVPMTQADGAGWNYDIHAYPKNQTEYPTLHKVVADSDDSRLTGEISSDPNSAYGDTATISEGDTANMRFMSRIPVITSNATKLSEYSFLDTQQPGLIYNKDEMVNVYASKTDAELNDPARAVWTMEKDKDYTVVYSDSDNTMKIDITEKGLATLNGDASSSTVAADKTNYVGHEVSGRQPGYSGCYITVAYTSLAASNANNKVYILGDDGNENDVKLTWRRSNQEYSDTIESSVKVFSYGLEVTKTFSDDKGDATKVEFVAQNKTAKKNQSGYEDTDDYYLKAKKISDGIYEVIESDGVSGTEATAEKDATRFIPGKDGKLKIYGLEGGTYEITEVKTDKGYSLLKNPIIVDINETTGEVTDSLSLDRADSTLDYPTDHIYQQTRAASATIDNNATTMKEKDGSANAIVAMNITNKPDFELPETGGSGLWMLTLAGMAGIAGGLFLIRKGKKELDED